MGNFEFNLGSWLDDNLTDDQNGMLVKIYINKEGCYCIFVDRKYSPEVTFENSPQEVELVIKK